MLGEMLDKVRSKAPLVHCITNYVTANDCANMLLACGASPIMADDPGEAAEVTAKSRGLVLNIGTLNQRTVPSMLSAGKTANELQLPIVFDPVGVGVSRLRTETAMHLLQNLHFAVIRGNMSEIRLLAQGSGESCGVDAGGEDAVTQQTLPQSIGLLKSLAQQTGAVVAASGAIDLVTDGQSVYCIYNGCSLMSKVTGTGCQLSAVIGAFAAANPHSLLEATAAAVCAMGLIGQIAHERLLPPDGTGTYRSYMIDAMSHLTARQLEEGADYEMR